MKYIRILWWMLEICSVSTQVCERRQTRERMILQCIKLTVNDDFTFTLTKEKYHSSFIEICYVACVTLWLALFVEKDSYCSRTMGPKHLKAISWMFHYCTLKHCQIMLGHQCLSDFECCYQIRKFLISSLLENTVVLWIMSPLPIVDQISVVQWKLHVGFLRLGCKSMNV